jgi:hypothetical protein
VLTRPIPPEHSSKAMICGLEDSRQPGKPAFSLQPTDIYHYSYPQPGPEAAAQRLGVERRVRGICPGDRTDNGAVLRDGWFCGHWTGEL